MKLNLDFSAIIYGRAMVDANCLRQNAACCHSRQMLRRFHLRRATQSRLVPKSYQNPIISFVDGDEMPSREVTLRVPLRVEFGEHLRLCGSDNLLGSWNVDNAPALEWTDGDVWITRMELPVGFESEFKFVHVLADQQVIWEDYIPNRVLKIDDTNSELSFQWCDYHGEVSVAEALEDEAIEPEPESGSEVAATPLVEDTLDQAALVDDEVAFSEEKQSAIVEDYGSETDYTAVELDDHEEQVALPEEKDEGEEQIQQGFKQAAKTAGIVAAGVAGAALLSTFAVDIVDGAVLSAFAVAAGGAALGSSKSKSGDQDEGDKVTSEPGAIIAAGLASAWDTVSSSADSGKASPESVSEQSNSDLKDEDNDREL